MALKVKKTTVKSAKKQVAAPKKSVSSARTIKKTVSAKVPSGKQTSAKKSSAKKIVSAPKKAAVPVKKTVAKKAAPKKVAVPVKKAAPAPKKAAPVKKAAPKKVAAPVKAVPAAPAKTPAVKKVAAKKATQIRKDEILKKLRLSKTDKKYFRDLLLHARSAFGAQVRYHSDDALTRKDAAGERAGMATHMADLGTDNYRRDFQLGLLSDGVDVLEMIDEALQRLEDSEYGICLDCGEPIPRKRLEAKPYAKYCTKCKSKREAMDETFYHRR